MRHISFILLFITPSFAVSADAYHTYVNDRYGYSIDYPDTFIPQGVADSGDGQVFVSADKDAELRSFAGACVEGMTSTPTEYVAHYKRMAKAGNLTLTYSRAARGFAVVSGIQEGRIYYNKLLIDKNGWCTEFNFIYERNRAKEYDPMTNHIAASFRR